MINLGIDIENIKRFRKLPYKASKSFYNKIFTVKEIKYCSSKIDPYPHFAVRFAAKEAVIKAIGGKIFNIKKIEIMNNKNGISKVNIKNLKGKILISLSHTNENAIAIAMWLD